MVILKAVVIAVLGSCLTHPLALSFPESRNGCNPSPCGANSVCIIDNKNYAKCECFPHYVGAPPNCLPECDSNTNCTAQMACLGQRCRDPCPGVCGINATCQIFNHNPTCSCDDGYTGDAFRQCTPILQESPAPDIRNLSDCLDNVDCPNKMACINQRCSDPCPGACGLNTTCFSINHRPICSCIGGFTGDVFTQCIPIPQTTSSLDATGSSSCLLNVDCPSHLACIRKLCSDPCPGVCGENATCNVIKQNPHCNCLQGFEGDPFYLCKPILTSTPSPLSTPAADVVSDPCIPFPCGPNARCNNGVCTNITEYIGVPYESCVPGCVLSSDCPSEHSCVRNKCIDPCPGTCGENAKCNVVNHSPVCTCLDGFKGDPFVVCGQVVKRAAYSVIDPCSPTPCGPNSQCRKINNNPICSCLKGFVGAPPSCRAECALSTDCLQTKACVRQTCVDPCQGACGTEAHCEVINHGAICSCRAGQSGDPCRSCSDIPASSSSHHNPCDPSPCGANAACKIVNDNPICTCIPLFVGAPPNCRPECIINMDCQKQMACFNQICSDPCPGTCGSNATCLTINHNPVCSCNDGHTGNPFLECRPVSDSSTATVPSESSVCVLNTDCPPGKACLGSKCGDPCPGVCGENSTCNVANHIPVCTCPKGYVGNPFAVCKIDETKAAHSFIDPCTPTPCGPNSQCRNINDNAVCSCQTGFVGSPPSCRSECVLSADCPLEKACLNQKCADPCLGACGQGASCLVDKHTPVCTCPEGYEGDPFVGCRIVEKKAAYSVIDPCTPTPCGPNSQCRNINDNAVCSCQTGFVGSPPSCRSECVLSADCPLEKACFDQKCADPCLGACGPEEICLVVEHNPKCSCPEGQTCR